MPIYFYLRASVTLKNFTLTANSDDLTLRMVVRRNDNGLECLRRCLVGQEDHKNCVYIGKNKHSVTDVLGFIAYELSKSKDRQTLTEAIIEALDVE